MARRQTTASLFSDTRVKRYTSSTGWYEATTGRPTAALAGCVLDYWGREERSGVPVSRREVPYPAVIVSISFGPKLRVGNAEHRSFVAGLHDRAVCTEHAGQVSGLEVALTPLTAHALFRIPMRELASRTIELDDVLPGAQQLADRLHEAGSWRSRFALLDAELVARLAAARETSAVAWAWRELIGSGGRAPVGRLTEELGWSRKRLAAQFREHVGLTPKAVARVLRFGNAVAHVRDGSRDWISIALGCGYYDQAHFNRDFREFSGLTPSQFAARLSPDDPGVRETTIQDREARPDVA